MGNVREQLGQEMAMVVMSKLGQQPRVRTCGCASECGRMGDGAHTYAANSTESPLYIQRGVIGARVRSRWLLLLCRV